jgi:hypothetical protein
VLKLSRLTDSTKSTADRLLELKKLLDAGALTKEERGIRREKEDFARKTLAHIQRTRHKLGPIKPTPIIYAPDRNVCERLTLSCNRVRLEAVDVAAVVLRGGVGEGLRTGDGLGGGAESREVRGGDQAGEASRHLIYLDQCHTGCGADPRLSPNTLRVATKTRDRSHRLRPNFVDFDQVLASAVVYARKFHAIDANRRQGDE